jgi:hypothetical protein
MAIPSASYAITMRVLLDTDPLAIGRVTTAVGQAGATVTAIDDYTVQFEFSAHALGMSMEEAVAYALGETKPS